MQKPLDVAVPNPLWLAMGVSTASLVLAPMARNVAETPAEHAETPLWRDLFRTEGDSQGCASPVAGRSRCMKSRRNHSVAFALRETKTPNASPDPTPASANV